MANELDEKCTLTVEDDNESLLLPSMRARVVQADGKRIEAVLAMRPLVIGTSPSCDLSVTDSQVSRRHCELRLTSQGILLRDLESKNGTLLGPVPIVEAYLPPAVPVTLGGSELMVEAIGEPNRIPLSPEPKFGDVIGQSVQMRMLFAMLARVAPTEQTILLHGESGTGKDILARAIHSHSPRKNGAFMVFDCGATTPSLIESELFGHVRGAFSGAASTHVGILEEANGGTVFLDEIGELPLDLQPKLLRALESRQIRKVGASEWKSFDARIVAATHRNLRRMVAEGSFREDLYYRLAVMEMDVPSLRERKQDIPALVERFLSLQDPPRALHDLPPHALSLLMAHDWPGNVRELRNVVARLIVFPELAEQILSSAKKGMGTAAERDGRDIGALLSLPLTEARNMVVDQFERQYISEKLKQYDGHVSRAAEAMQVSRQHVHRLIERYGIRVKEKK